MSKEYMYIPIDEKKIYISKDLDKIRGIDRWAERLINVYAVLDTPSGEKLFGMDFAYSGEPIVMEVYLHKDFVLKHYWTREIVTK